MNCLKKLEIDYNNCKNCPELVKNRKNVVFGIGNTNPKILIIGEAPGKEEDEKKEPFVGKSGQLLTGLLEEIGLTRKDVYITNTILCRPPNNRNPGKTELFNCSERLNKQIQILNPKIVITLGNFATRYILNTKEGITRIHGKVFFKENLVVVPMFHPAVLLYNGNSPKKRAEFLADFKVILKFL
jgi:uracil-DNA glycosylase